MPITLVSVKGSALTIPEFDGNFQDLDGRLEYFETGTGQPGASIVNVTAAGNVITFHMSDATTFSVVIPASLITFRGEWAPSTLYAANDIVVGPEATPYSRNLYLVTFAHTSDLTFDPGEATGGNDFYALMMPSELARSQEITTMTFDPVLLDAQSYNRCTNVSGCVVTVPDDGTVDFPIDTELAFRQCDVSGAVSFVGESTAVDINYPDDSNPNTAVRGAVVQLKKVGANEWDLYGRLELASA